MLILDQNMTPSAFFPSSYFTYQEPGVMSADRLEGVMRLTPALGQQKLYVLVFTTEKDLQQTTQLLDPAKAYAKGVGKRRGKTTLARLCTFVHNCRERK